MARAEASWSLLGSPRLTVLPGYGAARCRDARGTGTPMGLASRPPPALHRDASAGAGSPAVPGAKGRGADKEEPGAASQLLPARHAGRAGISAGPARASPRMGREGRAGPWLPAGPWGFWQLQEHVRWQPAFPRASPSPSPRGRLVALGTHREPPLLHPSLKGDRRPASGSPLPITRCSTGLLQNQIHRHRPAGRSPGRSGVRAGAGSTNGARNMAHPPLGGGSQLSPVPSPSACRVPSPADRRLPTQSARRSPDGKPHRRVGLEIAGR